MNKTRYSATIIQRAKLLYSRKLKPADIVEALKDEGHEIPLKTVSNWCYCLTRNRC